jgi:beta-glucosidase
MLNKKSLSSLLVLCAAGFLAAPGCKLAPPKITATDGGMTAMCSANGGSGGSGGGDDGGSGDSAGPDGSAMAADDVPMFDPVVCGSMPSAQKDQLKAFFKYAPGYTPSSADQQTVAQLMSQMTNKEKGDQLRGRPYGAPGKYNYTDTQRSENTRTVRGYRYRDASRGVNLGEDMEGAQPTAGMEGGAGVGFATVFPVSMARGAAFDLDLEYAIGEAIADEMMAAKQTLLLAPCMNLLRNPLWGRAQETYGEDPFHMGRMASAMTVGVQQHITANAKHYMGYDMENGRDQNDVRMDEQTLREIFARHFRMVVQDGGVGSVMASYNLVNMTKSTENVHTMKDVLRDDFGFQGFVLSDWWAMRPANNVDGVDTGTLKTYAINGMTAGLDVELPWALNYGQLESIVASGGGVTQEEVDTAVKRVLLQKVRFNSYDITKSSWGVGAPKTTYRKSRIGGCGYALHQTLSKKAAIEGMVLLKNASNTLPISSAVHKIAVLGATVPYETVNYGKKTTATMNFATDINTGDRGSSRVFSPPEDTVPPFQGLRDFAPSGVTVVNPQTAAEAADADFIVVVAGLTPGDEGEEYTLAKDRVEFGLDAKRADRNIQENLIRAAAALGKPMVVVLEAGSVVDMPWLDAVPAVVMAWYPGQRAGEALADLLWGRANFSAKLPFTWGFQVDDYEQLKAPNGATSFDYYVGYSRFDKNGTAPRYPFGYGLSYTTFKYDDLQLGCTDMSEGGVLPVYVTVSNTGSVAGDEIVMVWTSYPQSKAARRPMKELKGFARVSLAPGEQKQVLIPLRLKDLDYFDMASNQWVVEDGPVTISVGGSSVNFQKTANVSVTGYKKASSNY